MLPGAGRRDIAAAYLTDTQAKSVLLVSAYYDSIHYEGIWYADSSHDRSHECSRHVNKNPKRTKPVYERFRRHSRGSCSVISCEFAHSAVPFLIVET